MLKSAFNFKSLPFNVVTFATRAVLIASSTFSFLSLSSLETCTFPKLLLAIVFSASLSFAFAPDDVSTSNLRVTSPSKSLDETTTLFLLKSAFNFKSLPFNVVTFATRAVLIASSTFSFCLYLL
ncbi:hypothetical protein J7890_03580 [Mycoplasmopsis agalactiae]|uniref:hypothetical protein n=1 Tax=Mycoplasmopsis agalactiae TaxID=2110 RepID=UPI001F400399|nr:hypothetical protein [Mycoplasmopsis agalactiae]MCE6079199.1 hypothetical protein [Mycoplasmopsis agalactiae]